MTNGMDRYPASTIPTNPLNKRVYELACRIALVFDCVPEGVYLLLKHVIEQKDFENTWDVSDCPKTVRQNFKDEFLAALKKRYRVITLDSITTYRNLAIGKYSLCCGRGKLNRGSREQDDHTFSYVYYNDLSGDMYHFPEITLLRESVPEREGLDQWLASLEDEADELEEEDN